MFQSSPSPKTGRYVYVQNILDANPMFQSSPSPKTGRYSIGTWGANALQSSNPHPVRKLGAMIFIWAIAYMRLSSNPHPVRKLGAILITLIYYTLGLDSVPILTQSENWALCELETKASICRVFQSSPSPKTGRYNKSTN